MTGQQISVGAAATASALLGILLFHALEQETSLGFSALPGTVSGPLSQACFLFLLPGRKLCGTGKERFPSRLERKSRFPFKAPKLLLWERVGGKNGKTGRGTDGRKLPHRNVSMCCTWKHYWEREDEWYIPVLWVLKREEREGRGHSHSKMIHPLTPNHQKTAFVPIIKVPMII